MGGTETLILRLLAWYKQRNYRVILLTEEKITNEAILEDVKKVQFEHYTYDRSKGYFKKNNQLLSFARNEIPLIITQFFPEFFRCHLLLSPSKYQCRFRHVIYIVHPYSTYLCSKKLSKIGRGMLDIFLRKGNLVFMDEMCVGACVKFYNLNSLHYDFKILRLPIFTNKTNRIISNRTGLRILAVSRFEFPFKGYILGLVEAFARLQPQNPRFTLTIIGYGRDKDQVEKLIRTLPHGVTSSISLLDQLPSDQVNEHIRCCDVYVGMGTTVLDAANLGKIAIVAVGYQNANLALGYFHENYKSLGEIFTNGVKYRTFEELLMQIALLNEEEFISMSLKSKSALMDHYDIDLVAADLLNQGGKPFTAMENARISFIAIVNSAVIWFADHVYSKIKRWML
jgi:hypothetical protein